MKGTSLIVMAWRNLWRNRRRTLITLSSIVFGIFLAILFTAMQDRNFADTIDLAARLGNGHVTLQHPDYLETPKLTLTVRGSNELAEKALSQRHVIRTVQRITGHTMLATAGESFGAGFYAIDPESEDETTFSIIEGLPEGAMFETSRDGGIILGERLAKNLGAKMGHRIVYTMTDINGEIVSGLARLTGTVRTGSPGIDGGLCILPIDAVREVLGYGPEEVTQLAVFIEDQRKSTDVAEALQESIGDDVAALAWYTINPELSSFIAIKVGGARFIQILIAVLVAAGIFNTLFVNVMERLREFGIMLAIGFSPGKLFRLVMMESLWLAVVGLVAAALVTLGPYLYLSHTGLDVSGMVGEDANLDIAGVGMSTTLKVGIFPASAAIIALAAVIAIMLSGVYPAWKAGHVEPVKTIKIV
jgi:ABC-type lipoprotein release transport system permease subunit